MNQRHCAPRPLPCRPLGLGGSIAKCPVLPRRDARVRDKCRGELRSNVWSGSPNANNSSNAWNVNFNNGNANNNNRSNANSVRLVRGGA